MPRYKTEPLKCWDKAWKEIPDFYEELYDEVKDRADRGIAAVENEKYRVMTYEGNMGDEREFDLESTVSRLNIFLELLGESRKSEQAAAS